MVVTWGLPQIPRFAFEKFPGSKAELSTQMKSVGEAMAIGRTFQVTHLPACSPVTPSSCVLSMRRADVLPAHPVDCGM